MTIIVKISAHTRAEGLVAELAREQCGQRLLCALRDRGDLGPGLKTNSFAGGSSRWRSPCDLRESARFGVVVACLMVRFGKHHTMMTAGEWVEQSETSMPPVQHQGHEEPDE